MPVKNQALEKRPAQKHHHPVAIQSRFLSRRRDVIKILNPIPETAPNRLRTIVQQQHEFPGSKIADILQLLRNPGIDVITLDAQLRSWLWPSTVSFLSVVSTQPLEHQLNHVALPVMRRR